MLFAGLCVRALTQNKWEVIGNGCIAAAHTLKWHPSRINILFPAQSLFLTNFSFAAFIHAICSKYFYLQICEREGEMKKRAFPVNFHLLSLSSHLYAEPIRKNLPTFRCSLRNLISEHFAINYFLNHAVWRLADTSARLCLTPHLKSPEHRTHPFAKKFLRSPAKKKKWTKTKDFSDVFRSGQLIGVEKRVLLCNSNVARTFIKIRNEMENDLKTEKWKWHEYFRWITERFDDRNGGKRL